MMRLLRGSGPALPNEAWPPRRCTGVRRLPVAAKLISRPFRSAKAPERCASIDRCCTPAAAKMVENLARPPQLLDKAEAAKLLRISTRKVENHILRGELGSVRLGRKVFTTEPLIAEFIE